MWSGDFTGYDTQAWLSAWGVLSPGGSAPYAVPTSDPAAPGTGDILHVHYDAHSASSGCTNCGTARGGTQFVGVLAYSSAPNLGNQTALYMRYYLKLPKTFDWGLEGKLPGLLGGQSSGCASGSTHCPGAWSTRLAWHSGTISGVGHCQPGSCPGELYLFNCVQGGGLHVGRGNWNFIADDNWHSVEQFVDTTGLGSITIWYDGKQVLQTTLGCTGNDSIGGIFFQTFYGGSLAAYGPAVPTDSYFANFQVSKAKL